VSSITNPLQMLLHAYSHRNGGQPLESFLVGFSDIYNKAQPNNTISNYTEVFFTVIDFLNTAIAQVEDTGRENEIVQIRTLLKISQMILLHPSFDDMPQDNKTFLENTIEQTASKLRLNLLNEDDGGPLSRKLSPEALFPHPRPTHDHPSFLREIKRIRLMDPLSSPYYQLINTVINMKPDDLTVDFLEIETQNWSFEQIFFFVSQVLLKRCRFKRDPNEKVLCVSSFFKEKVLPLCPDDVKKAALSVLSEMDYFNRGILRQEIGLSPLQLLV